MTLHCPIFHVYGWGGGIIGTLSWTWLTWVEDQTGDVGGDALST